MYIIVKKITEYICSNDWYTCSSQVIVKKDISICMFLLELQLC